ncbi:unnamed protein product, partial [Rhizoctonia solani]
PTSTLALGTTAKNTTLNTEGPDDDEVPIVYPYCCRTTITYLPCHLSWTPLLESRFMVALMVIPRDELYAPAPAPKREPFDVRMTHASARPRLGFTYDFKQPEEEQLGLPKLWEAPQCERAVAILDSPPLGPQDTGRAKAGDVEPETTLPNASNRETFDNSITSSLQNPPAAKLASDLVCVGCRRPLRTGVNRLWALRCGHMIDLQCYGAISRPQLSSLSLLERLGSPSGPTPKRRKTTREEGKGKGMMESHEWECPVEDCARVHKSERIAGEDWIPAKDAGAIKVFT